MDHGLRASTGLLSNRQAEAVFLCYHSVHPDGPSFISVTPEQFEQHLSVLRRRRYVSGRCEDLAALRDGTASAERRAFLTFDDGYRDSHTYAWPLMRRHGFRGLVFVLPQAVGRPRLHWPEIDADCAARPHVLQPLTWDQIGEMSEDGMEFGSHSACHRHLRELGDEELRQDLLDSRMELMRRVGRCDTLGYPFGEWDLRVALAALDAGYSFAFSLPPAQRATTTAFSIPRVSVDHRDGPRRFALKLTPAVRALAFTGMVHQSRLLRTRMRHRRQS